LKRYVYYLCLTMGLMSFMVFIKLWLIPFVLGNLFPQTDLVSKLYEVLIMVFGGITFLLFIIQGYIGKHFFQFHWTTHFLLNFLIQLPFAMHALYEELRRTSMMMGWGQVFTEGWYGLMAEPTRLIFMVYPWTDIFAIAASFVFLAIGRTIEIVDEGRLWEQTQNRMKVGRI